MRYKFASLWNYSLFVMSNYYGLKWLSSSWKYWWLFFFCSYAEWKISHGQIQRHNMHESISGKPQWKWFFFRHQLLEFEFVMLHFLTKLVVSIRSDWKRIEKPVNVPYTVTNASIEYVNDLSHYSQSEGSDKERRKMKKKEKQVKKKK